MTPHSNISPEEATAELAKRELARRHLIDFNRYVYDGYKDSWHIQVLCEALEHVISGAIRFLIVEMPPRHSKSLNVSQLLPAYLVGIDPDTPIIVSSYSGDLATDHGRETRNIIDEKAYQNVFPTRLASDSTAKGKWNTAVLERGKLMPRKGVYNAAGVGGAITGKGARYFIIDDPLKDRKEADSQLIRDQRFKWMRAVARTRLTPDGRMIIMHTRWHQDDIIGRLTGEYDEDDPEGYAEPWVDYFDWLNGKRAKWVRLKLPAIAVEDELFRKEGEALWPGQYNLEELLDIKKSLGPYEWSALYQQTPTNDESREFKKEWVKYTTEEALQYMNCRRFLTIDTAMSKKAEADYTGFCDNRVNRENFWHLRAWRLKLSPEELVDMLFTLHQSHRYEKIGIEKTAYLVGLKPYLDAEQRKRGVYLPIVELQHQQTQKEIRIRGLVPLYAAGSVFHIKGQTKDLETEQAGFPVGTHDDTLDATAYQLHLEIGPARDAKKKAGAARRGKGIRGT